MPTAFPRPPPLATARAPELPRRTASSTAPLRERDVILDRLSLLLSDTRISRALIQTYEPPFPAVNLASTRASPARRVTPRRSAHSSSGIKYLRVRPRRSRNTARVAEPSSTSAASSAARNPASAPLPPQRPASLGPPAP